MKFEDVLSYKFEDRGFGHCVIWVDKFDEFKITPDGIEKRETVLNAESLANRIRNLRNQGLDTAFEEWALNEVIKLDAKSASYWRGALSLAFCLMLEDLGKNPISLYRGLA